MASREEIEARYRADLEVAEAWREANPERYAEAREKAIERRAESYSEMAQTAESSAREASLANARTSAISKYPKADPNSINGSTPEEIEASAKRSHEFVQQAEDNALKQARVARRPETRANWTGSPNGTRPGLPGGELEQPNAGQTDLVNRTYTRTAEIIAEARKPGTLRQYSDDATALLRGQDVEAQALADHQVLTPNTGLSRQAFEARSKGEATFTGEATPEDKRG